MVKINFELTEDGKVAKVTCPEKNKTTYTISKDLSGFIFYEISVDKGLLPKELAGKFSGIYSARVILEAYLRAVKESKTVRRDNVGERVMKEIANESESNTKGN